MLEKSIDTLAINPTVETVLRFPMALPSAQDQHISTVGPCYMPLETGLFPHKC